MEDYKFYAMTKEELNDYLSQVTGSMEEGKEKDDLIKKINDRINSLNEIEESEKARFSQRFEQWKADQETK